MSPSYPIGGDRWHGVWTDGFEAALMQYPNLYAYFFRSDQFQEFDIDEDRVIRSGKIGQDDWFGVWTEGLDGAIAHPSGFIYFFRGDKYQKYDRQLRKVVATREVGKEGWHGVWSDGIDAAFTFDGCAFFRQGDKYQRFDFQADKVVETGHFTWTGWQRDPFDYDGRRMLFKGGAVKNNWQVGVASLDEKNRGQFALAEVASPETAQLVNRDRGNDIFTEEKFGDCTVLLEAMLPGAADSGVYLMGEYEVQVLGGERTGPAQHNDLGAIPTVSKPPQHVERAPGEWLTFEIVFQAPKFAGGKKIANARFVKVTVNGTVLHENVELPGPLPEGLTRKEAATGPLMLQGINGPVAFRKIQIIKN